MSKMEKSTFEHIFLKDKVGSKKKRREQAHTYVIKKGERANEEYDVGADRQVQLCIYGSQSGGGMITSLVLSSQLALHTWRCLSLLSR